MKPLTFFPGAIIPLGNPDARKISFIRRFAARADISLSGTSRSSGRNNHPSTPNATSLVPIAKCARLAASCGV
jgi:hypothetical protein